MLQAAFFQHEPGKSQIDNFIISTFANKDFDCYQYEINKSY